VHVTYNKFSRDYALHHGPADVEAPRGSNARLVATARLDDAIMTTGWARLDLKTSPDVPNNVQVWSMAANDSVLHTQAGHQ
jgi:hypothetical protein